VQTQEAIMQRLQRLAITALDLDLPEIDSGSMRRLDEVAGLDSVTVLVFVVAVETEFGITFDAGELNRETIANLPRLAGRIAAHLER
jgi:acyl carrier protein